MTVSYVTTPAVSPKVAKALQELLQHDVAEWTKFGFEEIKLRTVRRVFRGQLASTAVHIKVFRADTIAAKAKKAMRTAKGEREAMHLTMAQKAGLPCVEPLAYGIAVDSSELNSFIVTRSVTGSDFAFPAPPTVASAAGSLMRQAHDAGFEPLDLHQGNLLITDGGYPILCDLTSLRHAGELSVRKRAAGLAFFCNPIDAGPLDSLTRDFLRGYKASGRPMADSFDAELARATRQLRAKSLKSFGRRSMRACKHTDAESRRRATPWFFWHLSGDTEDKSRRNECRSFQSDKHEARRSGRRGSVWLTESMAVKDRDAGKARKLWLANYWMLFAKVPIATPVALCLHGSRGKVFTNRLLNEDLQTELQAGKLSGDSIARCATALGNSIGRLHGHGLRNRDLKFDNLVRDPETDAIAIVDLDGVSQHAAEETRGCGRDLGRLLAAFFNADSPGGEQTLRRFLQAYVRTRRRMLQSPPMKRILKRAESRAKEWAARH